MFGQAGTLLNPKAGFSPLNIPGLHLWLAANQSSFTLNSGKVSQWDDLSGLGNHATQGTATLQPVLTRSDAKQNLQVYSQDFSQSPWVLSNTITKTDNFATDPNGDMTAAKLSITTGWMDAGLNNYVQNSNDVSLAFYVKKAPTGAATHTRLTTNDNAAWNTGISTKLALTDSWQRISFSGDALPSSAVTGVRVMIGCVDETGAVDSDCVGDILVAFASINDGTTLEDYAVTGPAPGYPGVNGFPGIKADEVDDVLESSTAFNSDHITGATQKTMIAAFKTGPNILSNKRILTGVSPGGSSVWGPFIGVSNQIRAFYRTDAPATASLDGATLSVNTTNVVALRHDGASVKAYLNSLTPYGTAADGHTTGETSTEKMGINNKSGATVAECLVTSGVATTDTDFNLVMNYLAIKYGVTLT